MPDQLGFGTATTPAPGAGAGAQFDVTGSGITDTAKAAVIFYSAQTADDSSDAPARIGVSLVSVEPTSKSASLGFLARDGLSAPDARTATGGFMGYTPRNSAFGTQFDQSFSYVSQISGGLRFDTDFDPLVQTKLSALIFAGSGMRSWLTSVVEASTTPMNVDCGPTNPTDQRFRPHLLIVLCKDSMGVSGQVNDGTGHLGFVIDDGSATQVCAFSDLDDATEPSDADGENRNDVGAAGLRATARGTRVTVTFGFNSTGFSVVSSSDTLDVRVLAVRFELPPRLAAKSFALDGSSTQDFALDFNPEAILGFASPLSALNSLDSSEDSASHGLFMLGPSFERAYAARMKYGESTTSSASSRQGDHALLLLDHVGSVISQGSYGGLPSSGNGFSVDFSPAEVGRITVLAMSTFQLAPDPLDIGLELPAPSIPDMLSPGAIDAAVELPAPAVILPLQPSPIDVAVSAPAPVVHVWFSYTDPPVTPELGDLHAKTLEQLLPRGVAWPRGQS